MSPKDFITYYTLNTDEVLNMCDTYLGDLITQTSQTNCLKATSFSTMVYLKQCATLAGRSYQNVILEATKDLQSVVALSLETVSRKITNDVKTYYDTSNDVMPGMLKQLSLFISNCGINYDHMIPKTNRRKRKPGRSTSMVKPPTITNIHTLYSYIYKQTGYEADTIFGIILYALMHTVPQNHCKKPNTLHTTAHGSLYRSLSGKRFTSAKGVKCSTSVLRTRCVLDTPECVVLPPSVVVLYLLVPYLITRSSRTKVLKQTGENAVHLATLHGDIVPIVSEQFPTSHFWQCDANNMLPIETCLVSMLTSPDNNKVLSFLQCANVMDMYKCEYDGGGLRDTTLNNIRNVLMNLVYKGEVVITSSMLHAYPALTSVYGSCRERFLVAQLHKLPGEHNDEIIDQTRRDTLSTFDDYAMGGICISIIDLTKTADKLLYDNLLQPLWKHWFKVDAAASSSSDTNTRFNERHADILRRIVQHMAPSDRYVLQLMTEFTSHTKNQTVCDRMRDSSFTVDAYKSPTGIDLGVICCPTLCTNRSSLYGYIYLLYLHDTRMNDYSRYVTNVITVLNRCKSIAKTVGRMHTH